MKTNFKNENVKEKFHINDYPYKVDYNDHFETPVIAYKDILPLLDVVEPVQKRKNSKTIDNDDIQANRSKHILYDPYYCDGQAAHLLKDLGFTNVKHEKRDFYKDVENDEVPKHDTFITNPPYSDCHKEKCVRHAVEQLRKKNDSKTPFFILMPNYVAVKNHFREAIGSVDGKEDPKDIFYVIPSKPYEYEHPEGTGKEIPPFKSIWFCGIPAEKVKSAKEAFRKEHGFDSVGLLGSKTPFSKSPRLLSTLQELKAIAAVPNEKRKNPKQRRKERHQKSKDRRLNSKGEKGEHKIIQQDTTVNSKNKKGKKSIYRDETGIRKKKRW
jgi:hypothetical protein